MASKLFILRIRHSQGTLRISLPNKDTSTITQVKHIIAHFLPNCPVQYQQLTKLGISTDTPLSDAASLSYLNIENTDMIYLTMIERPSNQLDTNNTNTNSNNTNNNNLDNNSNNSSNNISNNKKRKRCDSQSQPLKPSKRLKKTPKPLHINSLHNNGIIINGMGDNNELHLNNNVNVDQLKPPKTNTPQHKLIQYLKKCTNDETKFIMYLIIIFCAYYGWNASLDLIGESHRAEEILNKFLRKSNVRVSAVTFVTKNICNIMKGYNKNWTICKTYINKYASNSNIKSPNDLILPLHKHNSLSLILLTIMGGGDTSLINMVQSISDSDINDLETEWDEEYERLRIENQQMIKIKPFLLKRITAIVCGICRYCSDGNAVFNL